MEAAESERSAPEAPASCTATAIECFRPPPGRSVRRRGVPGKSSSGNTPPAWWWKQLNPHGRFTCPLCGRAVVRRGLLLSRRGQLSLHNSYLFSTAHLNGHAHLEHLVIGGVRHGDCRAAFATLAAPYGRPSGSRARAVFGWAGCIGDSSETRQGASATWSGSIGDEHHRSESPSTTRRKS